MKALLTLVTSLALVVGASAAEKKAAVPSAKLSDFAIGEVVSGPAVDLGNTGGKAVVIEAWGVNCGPCLASMPDIEKLSKRNKNDTIFIGVESQNSTEDQIKKIVKEKKVTYTITKGGLTKNPVSFSGIPHAFVFDTTGTLIYNGSPLDKEFDKMVAKAGRPATGATGLIKP
jgi:thiol-disulfide isomerase/thioredoxin